MNNISYCNPENILVSDWIEQYELEMSPVHWQLTQFNSNIHIMDRIGATDFSLLGTTATDYWHLTFASMFETNVMILWRLVDPNDNTLTLRALRVNIREHLINGTYQEKFEELMSNVGFDNTLDEVHNNIKVLRHNRFGHFQRKWIIQNLPSLICDHELSYTKLKELGGKLSNIYKLLCFSHGRELYLLQYSPNLQHGEGSDPRTDIEIVIDLMIKNSPFVTQPEMQPVYWPYLRNVLQPEDIELMNEYRKRVGLEPV